MRTCGAISCASAGEAMVAVSAATTALLVHPKVMVYPYGSVLSEHLRFPWREIFYLLDLIIFPGSGIFLLGRSGKS